jgi:hypothetical protein
LDGKGVLKVKVLRLRNLLVVPVFVVLVFSYFLLISAKVVEVNSFSNANSDVLSFRFDVPVKISVDRSEGGLVVSAGEPLAGEPAPLQGLFLDHLRFEDGKIFVSLKPGGFEYKIVGNGTKNVKLVLTPTEAVVREKFVSLALSPLSSNEDEVLMKFTGELASSDVLAVRKSFPERLEITVFGGVAEERTTLLPKSHIVERISVYPSVSSTKFVFYLCDKIEDFSYSIDGDVLSVRLMDGEGSTERFNYVAVKVKPTEKPIVAETSVSKKEEVASPKVKPASAEKPKTKPAEKEKKVEARKKVVAEKKVEKKEPVKKEVKSVENKAVEKKPVEKSEKVEKKPETAVAPKKEVSAKRRIEDVKVYGISEKEERIEVYLTGNITVDDIVVSSTYFPNRIFVGLNYAEGPAKKINITSKLIKEVVREIQRALLQADVNVKLVFAIGKNIKEKALNTKIPLKLSTKDFLINIVY